MYLIDVNNIITTFACHTIHHHLDALLEVTSILRACQHCAQVQHIDLASLQSFWHTATVDALCQSIDECRLAHARLAHVQRVVLVAATQHLDGAFQLSLSAYEWVLLVQHVVHTCYQSSPASSILGLFAILALGRYLVLIVRDDVADKLRLVVAQVLFQQIGRPRVLQLQHRHHHMGDVQCLGTARDHLHRRLSHELCIEVRRHQLVVDVVGHPFLLSEFLLQFVFQRRDVAIEVDDRAEHILAQQCLKHHLGCDEFISALLAGIHAHCKQVVQSFSQFDIFHVIL